jgi:copper chaperone
LEKIESVKHEVIYIENLKCSGCENAIRKALLQSPGVDSVSIEHEQEMVTITGADDLDRMHITAILRRLGYPERGTNNLMEKAKSYVSCAIGRMG